MQMANIYVLKYSISHDTREIKRKATLRFHFTPVRKTIIKKRKVTKQCQGVLFTIDQNVRSWSWYLDEYVCSITELPYSLELLSMSSLYSQPL